MTDQLLCVPAAEVAKLWPGVKDLIASAYEEMDEPQPDVLPWLIEERGQLWVLVRDGEIIAAGTTSLVIRGGGRLYLRCVCCGGSQADWQGVIAEIERYAKAEGCYKVRIDGRRGWGKVLSDYAPKCVSFEKRI